MSRAFGIYRHGRIELDSPVDWPEGARVAVEAADPTSRPPAGRDDRAALLAGLEAIEPLELTPADEAEIAAAREAVRQASLHSVRRAMGSAP